MTQGRLRFGVVARGLVLPAWQAQCVRTLLASGHAEPVVLIVEDGHRNRPSSLAARLYEDCRVRRRSRALRAVSLEPELAGLPALQALGPGPPPPAWLRDQGLDFILSFGSEELGRSLHDRARHGVWAYWGGDPDGAGRCLSAFARRDAVSRVQLVRLAARAGDDRPLYEGYFELLTSSYAASLDVALIGSADFCAAAVARLRLGHPMASGAGGEPPRERDAAAAPSTGRVLELVLREACGFASAIWGRLFLLETWNVGIVRMPAAEILRCGLTAPVEWWVKPSWRRFYADPFAIAWNGRLHVLVEDYDWLRARGRISAVDARGPARGARVLPAIELATHMSYPCLIVKDGQVYCVPEIGEAGRLTLFRARRFPDDWEDAGTLVENFAAIDPTVFEHDGRWWLLCTNRDDCVNGKLHCWHAPNLAGPWQPHPLNPLKCDVRSSRPAGPPFVVDGALHRPAQDCSGGYGSAVAINRIRALSPSEFVEEKVARIEPNPSSPYPHGLHTICPVGDMVVIDGKRLVVSPMAVLIKIWGSLVRARQRRP
jgi:hypothetical protein